ncbi:MAG: helix-turn-helix transcriptional regulator [Spirochaetales bacterium]|jgi:AraC-like DNA-binding protein|nr:helix-turn-helix transcriptional regulator [Spirochaetales bacterium]
MKIFFLIGISQSLFLALLVFSKKKSSQADNILAFWFILLALNLLDYYFSKSGFALKHPYLLSVGTCIPLLHGPILLIYIQSMVRTKARPKWHYLLHFIPFIVFTIYLAFDFYFLDLSGKLAFYEQQNVNPNSFIRALVLSKILAGPIYVLCSFYLLRKHKKNIVNAFSHTDGINLIWLKYVLGGIGFTWSIVLFTKISANFSSAIADMDDNLIYISLTVVIFILGYFGIKQQAIYSNISLAKKEFKAKTSAKNRYSKSGLNESDSLEYRNRLLDFMENRKPYLDGKTSLREIAEDLDLSVNYLSQVINEQLKKSFFDFINEYRVNETKKRFQHFDYKHNTILEVAYQSGFNSKSSFNVVFKKHTGLTPSQYIKNKTT